MGWMVFTLSARFNSYSVEVEEFGSQASVCEYIQRRMKKPDWSVIYVVPSITCNGKTIRVCLPDGCIGNARVCGDLAWLVGEEAAQAADAAVHFIKSLFSGR